MGIKGLGKLLHESAPKCIKETTIKSHFGRRVAVDASMSLYQFLVAVRSGGQMLEDENGETTSHIIGMFYRTIRMLENGLKPVYVFDGKPPTMKNGELAKRLERRKEAAEKLELAEEEGNVEEANKMSKRTVKITSVHSDECKKLFELMGVPYIDAPCEAEAQCAKLAQSGLCYAAASEDMDTLTFGAPKLLRNLLSPESKKIPVREFDLQAALDGIQITKSQFIDLCILCGCDYTDSIKGIGPKKALQLIKKHNNIENILLNIDKKKYLVPENWQYQEARELFINPLVSEVNDLKWNDPDEEGLIQYLVNEKNFSMDRVVAGIKKIKKFKNVGNQKRITEFFKPAVKKMKME